jgi:uncharacterized membrane protein YiaA
MTQPIKPPKDHALTVFGFALLVVGLVIFLMGPQKSSTLALEQGLASVSVDVLLLFCGFGMAFVVGSILHKPKTADVLKP